MKTISNGRRLELALIKKRIKKSELAEKMGKSRQHVNMWTKKSQFSLKQLTEILAAINMTHAAFFSLTEG